jgi:hypothetical protein
MTDVKIRITGTRGCNRRSIGTSLPAPSVPILGDGHGEVHRRPPRRSCPRDLCLATEQEPGEHEHPAASSEECKNGEVPDLPTLGLLVTLSLDVEALGPVERVHLLEQVKPEPFALELNHALAHASPSVASATNLPAARVLILMHPPIW